MKGIAWVLLIGLWCGSLAMAQVKEQKQYGFAVQELKDSEPNIKTTANFRFGDKVKVINQETQQSVVATVVGRIPAVPGTRLAADVSSNVWNELGLNANTMITIEQIPPSKPHTDPPPHEETEIAQEPPPPDPDGGTPPPDPTHQVAQNGSGAEGGLGGHNPIYIKVEVNLPDRRNHPPRHVSAGPPPVAVSRAVAGQPAVADTPPQTSQKFVPDADLQRRLTAVAAHTQTSYATPPSPNPAPVPVAPPPPPPTPPPEPKVGSPVKPQVANPAPVQPVVVVPSYNLSLNVIPIYQTEVKTVNKTQSAPVSPPSVQPPPPPPVNPPPIQPPTASERVSPGYPDPNCGKLYTLQVGAYSTASAAAKVESLLRNYGFNVSQELSSPYYKVVIAGVPESMVHDMVQRLGAVGIEDVIIR